MTKDLHSSAFVFIDACTQDDDWGTWKWIMSGVFLGHLQNKDMLVKLTKFICVGNEMEQHTLYMLT